MMKCAYLTILSTNDYYKGVIALFESLKRTNPKYNEFVVVINETIDNEIINKLKNRGYTIILKNKISFPQIVNDERFAYWSNSFDKLNIFDLTQYDKILYLDSDMYIARNIDELFNYPHLTGAISGKECYKEWNTLNTGLMVIVPETGVVQKLINVVYEHKFDKEAIGDQDIINYYYDWPNKKLAISESYNIFADVIDSYVNQLHYNLSSLGAIHFIGARKPWMLSKEELKKFEDDLIKNNKKYQLYFLIEYMNLIKNID